MKKLLLVSIAAAIFVACSKDDDPVIVLPPSNGSTMELNGTTTNAGANAENSVFVDFSADKQTTVARESWDLGFYTGSDFRVIINNTTFAFAKVTSKTDINAVSSADTVGAVLAFNQNSPPLLASGVADDPGGNLSNTSIPAISSTDADNKVVVINRGTNGGIAPKEYAKIRILRSGAGYTLQYATLGATTFKTVQIAKNTDNDFVYVSLGTGATISTFPLKKAWDIKWGYSVMSFATYFYGFSDVVTINHLNGVQAFQTIYADAAAATDAFSKFNKDSVAKYTFSSNPHAIGSQWRYTGGPPPSPAPFTRKERFYVVKDTEGNIYKMKFLSFASEDGGTRGKPQIKYELIK